VDRQGEIERIGRFFSDGAPVQFEGRAAAVFAHPDDETIACGGQLSRFADLELIVVTDGAPPDQTYLLRKGFGSAEAYARARWSELEAALSAGGLSPGRARSYGVTDGSASRRVLAIVERLKADLDGKDLVLTHCYEGGHSDHDAVALAVHAACAVIAPDRRPVIVEAPLYSLQADGWTPQVFASGGSGLEVSAPLGPGQQATKRRMKACYATQADVLSRFADDEERFRIAPRHDFGRLPNGGVLMYQADGSFSGSEWLSIAQTCTDFLERTRGSAPQVTLDESLAVLRSLVDAVAPPPPQAAVVRTPPPPQWAVSGR
jgi:LmbE family N-acetylglucosaminyl deacetylase